MKTELKVLSGFLAGAAAGALLGILFAPDSGHKTRRKIVRNVKDFEEDLEKATSKKFNQAKEKIVSKLEGVKESMNLPN